MILIGQGRVGGGLERLANVNRVPVHMVTRDDDPSSLNHKIGKPILVCTNAGDIEALVRAVKRDHHPDLVFVQNGMIDPALRKIDCDGCTRGLLYFAAPSREADIVAGAASIFTGPHADAMVEWFSALGLEAKRVSRAQFTAEMASKLIWNCTFGLLCHVYDQPVGELVENRRGEVDDLIAELCAVSNEALGTKLIPSTVSAELCAYSMSIADYKGALKQWRWRNGWFVELARAIGVDTPLHTHLLADHCAI